MNCKGLIGELSNYIDDELDPTVKAELERHLEYCEDCRLVVDTTRKTVQIFCNSEPVPLPIDVRSRLHTAVEKRMRKETC